MPQLDSGIFFYVNLSSFLFFWLIYILLGKYVYPFLNKTIKLRRYKLIFLEERSIFFLFSVFTKFNNLKFNTIMWNNLFLSYSSFLINRFFFLKLYYVSYKNLHIFYLFNNNNALRNLFFSLLLLKLCD